MPEALLATPGIIVRAPGWHHTSTRSGLARTMTQQGGCGKILLDSAAAWPRRKFPANVKPASIHDEMDTSQPEQASGHDDGGCPVAQEC